MMKIFINNILILFTAAIFLVACDKEELTVLNSGASTTVSLSAGEVVLDILNTGQDVLTVSWTEPDYGFSAGVNYSIIFTNGDKTSTVSAGPSLTKTFETVELNKILLNIGLMENVTADLTVQVQAILSATTSISSNVAPITATPFSTTFEPIYMIGDAVLGWDTGKAVEVYGTGPGTYEVIAEFNNGGAFRFFEIPDWGATTYNWTYFEGGSIDANFENAADGDTNLRFVGTTGYYKINVDLITKTITMIAVDKPTLYMVGAGVPAAGWGWDTPVDMTWVKDGVFEATTEFSNDAFRFFTSYNDWASGLNYPYYVSEEFAIDANFEDALDGDNNFKFIGTPGTYTITVNNLDKTVTLTSN